MLWVCVIVVAGWWRFWRRWVCCCYAATCWTEQVKEKSQNRAIRATLKKSKTKVVHLRGKSRKRIDFFQSLLMHFLRPDTDNNVSRVSLGRKIFLIYRCCTELCFPVEMSPLQPRFFIPETLCSCHWSSTESTEAQNWLLLEPGSSGWQPLTV